MEQASYKIKLFGLLKMWILILVQFADCSWRMNPAEDDDNLPYTKTVKQIHYIYIMISRKNAQYLFGC